MGLRMLPTLRRGISHQYVRSALLRSLHCHHQRSLSAEDASEQSRAVLGWIQHVHRSRKKALQTVRSYVRDEVPLAYLLGTQPFCGLDLKVRPPVLIPRPETEEWTVALTDVLMKALKERDSPFRIVDLCSGSGCIGLALADLLKDTAIVQVVGIESNPDAIALAKENAQVHRLDDFCKYEQADLFDDSRIHNLLEQYTSFDMVVSNPPYIPQAEYDVLERSVKDYEDKSALLGEAPDHARKYSAQDGLAFYRRICELLLKLVKSSISNIPLLVLEVGQNQASIVAAMFTDIGFECSIVKDFSGIERSIWVYQKR